MLYGSLIPALTIIGIALSNPLPSSRVVEVVSVEPRSDLTWPGSPRNPSIALSKRNLDVTETLGNGNECVIQASAGDGTGTWTPEDFANMYDQTGRTLIASIARRTETNVGITFTFRDHNNNDHQIDAHASTTGHATVSVAGAYDNVGRALIAAETLADHQNTGLIGTARSTFRILFGAVDAISIAVNVLN